MADSRLKNACEGKTYAEGGLNVSHLVKLAKERGYNGLKKREDLIAALCPEAKDEEGEEDARDYRARLVSRLGAAARTTLPSNDAPDVLETEAEAIGRRVVEYYCRTCLNSDISRYLNIHQTIYNSDTELSNVLLASVTPEGKAALNYSGPIPDLVAVKQFLDPIDILVLNELAAFRLISTPPLQHGAKLYGCLYNRKNNELYIVMDYVKGADLDNVLRINDTKAQRKHIGSIVAPKLAAAIHEFHTRGIAHRDIMPPNVMFNSETGDVKLVGYDFATFSTSQLVDMSQLGHPTYRDPMITEGNMDSILAGDWFSYCQTLFDIYLGDPLDETDEDGEVLEWSRKPTPRELQVIPAPIRDIVRRIMDPDADRPSETEIMKAVSRL